MREVRAEPTLDEADQEQVGEPAGQHPVQRVGALGPPLRERQSVDPLGVEAEPLVQICRDLESGGVDEQIHRVLHTVHHRASGGDFVDASSFGVHQMHVGQVERRR